MVLASVCAHNSCKRGLTVYIPNQCVPGPSGPFTLTRHAQSVSRERKSSPKDREECGLRNQTPLNRMAAQRAIPGWQRKRLTFHFSFRSLGLMAVEFTYRGKTVHEVGIDCVKQLIAENPRLSRRRLSTKLCLAWNWAQANGHPRDMVCRGLLLGLHRAGLIELPAKRMSPRNPLARRVPPQPVVDQSWEPVECPLSGLGPIEIGQVRCMAEEKLFGRLMKAHHYLGYTQPVGEHLKYIYHALGTPIACMAWSSSPRHLETRDRFIG
jgi:hypothetical protein